MELKNVNLNGDDVEASNLINSIFFIFYYYFIIIIILIVKIVFKIKQHMLFFLKDTMIAQKTKFLLLLTSLINIEWIKASFVDMDPFHKKKRIKNIWKFLVYLQLPRQLEKNA
jgi:hypothetical protein